jgi:hypothetical protein
VVVRREELWAVLVAIAPISVQNARRGDIGAVRRSRFGPPLFIAAVLAGTTLVLAGCGGSSGEQVSPSDRDRAVDQAQAAYREVAGTGEDLSSGPCIAESLPGLPDWVVDVAHDPRQVVDDEPANQCQRYRDGEAQHFVELDEDGTLIRAE